MVGDCVLRHYNIGIGEDVRMNKLMGSVQYGSMGGYYLAGVVYFAPQEIIMESREGKGRVSLPSQSWRAARSFSRLRALTNDVITPGIIDPARGNTGMRRLFFSCYRRQRFEPQMTSE